MINPFIGPSGLFGQQSWICPKCGRVYSPTTPMCLYCKNETSVVSNLSDRFNESINENELKKPRKQE